MRFVIDCITATRTTRALNDGTVQTIEFSVWLNIADLRAPVTARIQPTEVGVEYARPLTPPIPIGPITGGATHQHSGVVTDIAPATHHRLTIRVQDGDGHEYVGSLEITRDDVELMATDLGPPQEI